jgi:tRNA(Ile2) C34 agmatinyltransferase TiaS
MMEQIQIDPKGDTTPRTRRCAQCGMTISVTGARVGTAYLCSECGDNLPEPSPAEVFCLLDRLG